MSTAIKTETSHLIWSPQGKPVSIHVNPRVLARLRPGLPPATGERVVERGGLLLGYAREIGDRWLIAVEDFREVRTGYQRGESWVIGPGERRALQSSLRDWSRERRGDHPYVVGWYRTHTRPGLYLDESDFRFFWSTSLPRRMLHWLFRRTRVGSSFGKRVKSGARDPTKRFRCRRYRPVRWRLSGRHVSRWWLSPGFGGHGWPFPWLPDWQSECSGIPTHCAVQRRPGYR